MNAVKSQTHKCIISLSPFPHIHWDPGCTCSYLSGQSPLLYISCPGTKTYLQRLVSEENRPIHRTPQRPIWTKYTKMTDCFRDRVFLRNLLVTNMAPLTVQRGVCALYWRKVTQGALSVTCSNNCSFSIRAIIPITEKELLMCPLASC